MAQAAHIDHATNTVMAVAAVLGLGLGFLLGAVIGLPGLLSHAVTRRHAVDKGPRTLKWRKHQGDYEQQG